MNTDFSFEWWLHECRKSNAGKQSETTGISGLDNSQRHRCMESHIIVSITCRCLLQDLRQFCSFPQALDPVGNTSSESLAKLNHSSH